VSFCRTWRNKQRVNNPVVDFSSSAFALLLPCAWNAREKSGSLSLLRQIGLYPLYRIILFSSSLPPELAVPSLLPTTMMNDEEKSVATAFTTTTYSGRDSQEIRSRLLSRLGIYDASSSATLSSAATTPSSSQPMTAAQQRRVRILRGMGVGYTMFKSPPDGSATRKPLNGVVPSKEPLKVNYEEKDDLVGGENNVDDDVVMADNLLKKKTTRIAFVDEVDVLPIPTRHEYSDRIKSRIWSNRHELQENAERNAVEFASEGWNWQSVKEDDEMYICSASGELVHPAWVGDIPKIERGVPAHSSD
jgi:hypothetical protein